MSNQIAIRLEAMQSFAINLDIVADRRGNAPGNGAIVADLDERAARNSCARYFIIIVLVRTLFAAQMHQVPDGRQGHAQVRIVAQQRRARFGTSGCDGPTVAAAAGRMETASDQNSARKAKQCRGRVPGRAGDDRRAVRIGGKERAELLRLLFELVRDGEKVEAGL